MLLPPPTHPTVTPDVLPQCRDDCATVAASWNDMRPDRHGHMAMTSSASEEHAVNVIATFFVVPSAVTHPPVRPAIWVTLKAVCPHSVTRQLTQECTESYSIHAGAA